MRMRALSKVCARCALPAVAAMLPLGWTATAWAQERERCYPGPPIYILRELLSGNYTPERYRAVILEYARAKCANGQTLKLVSPAGPGAEDKLNEQIALQLCDGETLYRERLAAGERALVVFCVISKLDPSSR